MDRLDQLRTMIAAGQQRTESTALESLNDLETSGGGAFTRIQADAVLDHIISSAKATRERTKSERREFENALATLQAHAPLALQKLVGDTTAPVGALSANELASLEAIVIADGSRPSFLLDAGIAPLQNPFMGTWKDPIATNQQALARIAGSIGRIQPKYGHNGRFIGTGSLVDKDKGIILTNFHVLDDAPLFGVRWEDSGNGAVKFLDEMEIDFIGEAYTFEENRFRIIDARRHAQSGRGFGHIDAVTMRIEPIDAKSQIPEAPVRLSGTVPDYKNAQGSSFCTIGFPSEPSIKSTSDVDWNFVLKTLFESQFGAKRLAPGKMILPLEANIADPLRISFGHDATTFGGASGSPIIAWNAPDQPVVGLHFAGRTMASNYAIAIAKVTDELISLGVPI
jgi:hypothetical protein